MKKKSTHISLAAFGKLAHGFGQCADRLLLGADDVEQRRVGMDGRAYIEGRRSHIWVQHLPFSGFEPIDVKVGKS